MKGSPVFPYPVSEKGHQSPKGVEDEEGRGLEKAVDDIEHASNLIITHTILCSDEE